MRRTTTKEKANAEGPELDGKHFVHGEAADHNGTYMESSSFPLPFIPIVRGDAMNRGSTTT
jgi:hypothetical protein